MQWIPLQKWWCGGANSSISGWLQIWAVLPLSNSGGQRWSNYRLPTFSPLITTPKNQNFVTLDFYYRLQTPMFFLWSSNNSFPKGFVNRFANWFSDLRNSTLISLLFISSRIKWYLVSICLLLLWKTWFLDSVIAYLFSHKI